MSERTTSTFRTGRTQHKGDRRSRPLSGTWESFAPDVVELEEDGSLRLLTDQVVSTSWPGYGQLRIRLRSRPSASQTRCRARRAGRGRFRRAARRGQRDRR